MKKFLKRIIPASLRHRNFDGKVSDTHMRVAMRRISGRGLTIGTVIDVGASDGRWSARAKDYFQAADYILVEANPYHKPALEAFCVANPRTRSIFAAASDKTGTVRFNADDPFGGKAEPGDDPTAIEVDAVRLDDAIGHDARAPYLLKLDTHGYELPILEGAKEVLANAGLVIIEVYNFKIAPEALLFDQMVAYMRDKGFGVVDMSDPLWRPGDKYFWQMDLYFQPLTSPELQNATYF